MVAPKWGRITDSHLLKLHLEHFTHLNELSGLSVGETSACLWGQLWAQLVNHYATRGQVSISLAGN